MLHETLYGFLPQVFLKLPWIFPRREKRATSLPVAPLATDNFFFFFFLSFGDSPYSEIWKLNGIQGGEALSQVNTILIK